MTVNAARLAYRHRTVPRLHAGQIKFAFRSFSGKEFIMHLGNWCKPWVNTRRSRLPEPRFRPELLSLENRLLPSVSVSTNFRGLDTNDAGGFIEPPDTIAAAGPTHVVEIINSNIAFYDKTTGAAVLSEGVDIFFAPVDSVRFLFSDVYVMYDESAGRFFVSTMDLDFMNEVS